MSTLLGPLWERPEVEEQTVAADPTEHASNARCDAGIGEEQIRVLAQQLFFRHEIPVRHVALVSPDPDTDTAALCFNLARVLAQDAGNRVAVIDASPGFEALKFPMDGVEADRDAASWKFAPQQWAIPMRSWLGGSGLSVISDHSLERLREISAGFEFSLIRCAPVMRVMSRVGHACHGFVLVLMAHQTRRAVAAQMRDQLRGEGIPVLGSVLAGRRFPIPERLYRKL